MRLLDSLHSVWAHDGPDGSSPRWGREGKGQGRGERSWGDSEETAGSLGRGDRKAKAAAVSALSLTAAMTPDRHSRPPIPSGQSPCVLFRCRHGKVSQEENRKLWLPALPRGHPLAGTWGKATCGAQERPTDRQPPRGQGPVAGQSDRQQPSLRASFSCGSHPCSLETE